LPGKPAGSGQAATPCVGMAMAGKADPKPPPPRVP
jgi:hypothetical protein